MAKASWKIWEQFAHAFKHTHSWFIFLSNAYPVVCERLARCGFLQISALSFSLILAPAAKATGRARDAGAVAGFCLGCSIHVHHVAFETHHVAAGIGGFLQQPRERI